MLPLGAELGANQHLATAPLEGAPDELLGETLSVDVRRVDEVDAVIDRGVDDRLRFGVIATPRFAKAIRAQPRLRDFEP